MTLVYILGAAIGLGIVLMASSFIPTRPPLARALRQLHSSPLIQSEDHSSGVRLLGVPWLNTSFGQWSLKGSKADLAICNVSAAEYLAQRVAIAAIAVIWAPVTTSLIVAAGISVPIMPTIWMSLVLAPLGFFYPSFRLRTRAADARRAFRHAFGAFLDIVSVSLAGGKGVESALTDGANAGSGWTFERLREALLAARLQGATPWSGLADLGKELELPELQELAASAALAGSEGARVRMSVAAKAKALRLKGLADVESLAQSASERMSIPVVALMMGFVFFLGYPAVAAVIEGL